MGLGPGRCERTTCRYRARIGVLLMVITWRPTGIMFQVMPFVEI